MSANEIKNVVKGMINFTMANPPVVGQSVGFREASVTRTAQGVYQIEFEEDPYLEEVHFIATQAGAASTANYSLLCDLVLGAPVKAQVTCLDNANVAQDAGNTCYLTVLAYPSNRS